VSPAFDPSDRLPSGGWVASAEDAARLGFALVDRGFLSESARALLLESQRTSAGEPTGTSIGVRTGVDAAGRRILHHGGTSVGARAFLLVYPDHGVAVALLANGPAEFAEAEVGRVAEVFLAD
jgi:CubicO group peptidase (beta-lactamase class C family)